MPQSHEPVHQVLTQASSQDLLEMFGVNLLRRDFPGHRNLGHSCFLLPLTDETINPLQGCDLWGIVADEFLLLLEECVEFLSPRVVWFQKIISSSNDEPSLPGLHVHHQL